MNSSETFLTAIAAHYKYVSRNEQQLPCQAAYDHVLSLGDADPLGYALPQSRTYCAAFEITLFTVSNAGASAWLMPFLIIRNQVFYCDLMGSITHPNGTSQQQYSPEPITQPSSHSGGAAVARTCDCTQRELSRLANLLRTAEKCHQETLIVMPCNGLLTANLTMVTNGAVAQDRYYALVPLDLWHALHRWYGGKEQMLRRASISKSYSKQAEKLGPQPQWQQCSHYAETYIKTNKCTADDLARGSLPLAKIPYIHRTTHPDQLILPIIYFKGWVILSKPKDRQNSSIPRSFYLNMWTAKPITNDKLSFLKP